MTIATYQTLNNRLGPGQLTMGSTAGADTNDPTRLAKPGGSYLFVPDGAGNGLTVITQFTNTLTWTTKVVGKLRTAPGTSGRFLTIGFQAFLDIDMLGRWLLTYRTAGNGYGAVGAVASPIGGAGVLQDVGFELTPTGYTFYGRSVVGKLSDQAVDDWTGWTSFATVTGLSVVPGDLNSTNIGSNVAANLWTNAPIYEATMKIDAQERTFDASNPAGWAINRAATGLKTALVPRPVILPDGVNDYSQPPYTPTFTQTTGKLTVIMAVRLWDSAFKMLLSSETSANVGMLAYESGGFVVVGIGSTLSDVQTQVVASPSIGQMACIAVVVDNGVFRVRVAGSASSGPGSLATLSGNPSHGLLRFHSRGYAVELCDSSETFGYLIADGVALSDSQIDAIAARLIAGDYA